MVLRNVCIRRFISAVTGVYRLRCSDAANHCYVGSLSPRHGASSGCGQPINGGPSAWRLSERNQLLSVKKKRQLVTKCSNMIRSQFFGKFLKEKKVHIISGRCGNLYELLVCV
jgi:hypothetical protein